MLINDSTRQRVDWSGPNNIGEKQSYFQGFMTSTNDQFQELSQNFMYGPMMHGYPMYPYAYHPYPMPPFDYYYQRGYNYPALTGPTADELWTAHDEEDATSTLWADAASYANVRAKIFAASETSRLPELPNSSASSGLFPSIDRTPIRFERVKVSVDA